MLRPNIIISTEPEGERYSIKVQGRFGGGYACRGKSREAVIIMLARDGRNYDCGEEPIKIIAPDDIRAAAGF